MASDNWVKDLLADVARDLSERNVASEMYVLALLERRLLPLLEAGQMLADECCGGTLEERRAIYKWVCALEAAALKETTDGER